ncbi:MAG: hydrogenase nickel incorporation protein HypB [Planctomycetaceae bacterium]
MKTVETTRQTIVVDRDVLSEKKQRAADLRRRFTERGTLVLNLVSSPGAGKTSLLEATARHWNGTRSMAVLVGDLATERDADRLRPFVPVQQLTTGGACHLELSLVEQGLARLPAGDVEFLFIENIGNLVCPASHDLAEHLRIALLSTTEGDDKPGKYPKMFRTSDALVISKTDLLPYVPFRIDAAVDDARKIQPELKAFGVCSLTGEGVAEWCAFLDAARTAMLSAC